jgi:hypothetical protein
MKINANTINLLVIFGMVIFAIWSDDYPKAIFFYLVLKNVEEKL